LNDTCVTPCSVRGDLSRTATLLADQSDVLAHDVSGDREGPAYIHFQPTETAARLLSIVRGNEIVPQTPIDCLPEGGVRVTTVGDDGTIRRVVDAIPDSLTLTLEGLGDYHPTPNGCSRC
jgi:hypothetical protein